MPTGIVPPPPSPPVESAPNANADPAPPFAITPPGPTPGVPGAQPGPAPSSGLTAEQLDTLRVARRDGRKVVRAARVAAFSGWTMATFAAITIITGIFSLPGFLLGIGMAVVAWVELRGSKGLRQLDLDAPRRLGLNQLALAAMMSLYGGWGVYDALTGPNPYAAEIAAAGPQVEEILGPYAEMQTMISVAVYVGVIIGALVATGSASIYYFTRRSHIERHLRRTPAWVVETLRSVG